MGLYIQLSHYRFGTGAAQEIGFSPTLSLQLNAALAKPTALANCLSSVMPGHESMIKCVNVSSTFWSEIVFFLAVMNVILIIWVYIIHLPAKRFTNLKGTVMCNLPLDAK